ncbi:hypothetical protein [Actinacidiphila acididurans]|uniref:LamG-like jellyroll fold domain-containing protein n=1 Tax=Actinacidiphila acididurans TaxID=2784346 RepID=A0ABS2TME8_9ACTN|nr:hypothetical protein [Actinacidiphila acididurans]MBM9504519.1 hypothetical protein [Actinacidiphila acididurans]
MINPNWPIIEDAWAPAYGANGGGVPAGGYVQVTPLHQSSTRRGRQYELDQIQAGEYTSSLDNATGALDPTNTAGPWYGHIAPYQPFRKRAQWPPTPNLLTQVLASGGDTVAAGTVLSPDVVGSDTDTAPTVVASGTAWVGSNVLQAAVPVSTAAGSRIVHTSAVAVRPGATYAVQLRVRDVTAGTSLSVAAVIGWLGPTPGAAPVTTVTGASSTLTGGASAPWTLVAVTATAPATAYGMDIGVSLVAGAGATCAAQVDGWQVERAAAPSAWTMPGTWYPLIAGLTERWPSVWTTEGYGEVQPTTTDAVALLSQVTLADPLTAEISSHRPVYLYTCADPAEAAAVTDTIGAYPAVPIRAGKYGAGSVTLGTDITATTPAGTYTGASGTVARFASSAPGTGSATPADYLSLDAAGIRGPVNSTYTRLIAFRYIGAAPPTTAADLWCTLDSHHAQNPSGTIRLYIDSTGKLNALTSGFFTGGLTLTSAASVTDGNWHLALFGYSAGSSGNFFLSLDGGYLSTPAGSGYSPTGIVSDSIGAFVDGTLGAATSFAFSGDLSYVGELADFLSSTDCANLYAAWRSACSGESTGARYRRILRYAGYTGATNIATGQTTSMGPATDITGQDAFTALTSVVTTENGEHFVSADGTLTFKGRDARYNATTPAVIFGEGAGEYPYEECALDLDSTHLANMATITQTGTGQTFAATDAASVAAYGARTFTRDINATSAGECQDAANHLVSRYRNALTRVTTLRLHPSAYPALWPVALGLELGMRVRIKRRPFGAPVITVEAFIESIQWDFDDRGEAWCVLQCSPVDTTPYAVFSSWHTTMNVAPLAGITTLTINAPTDNVNPLSAQIYPGLSLILGPGTATQETVTVKTVGFSVPGWATANIVFTAPTTQAHAGGDVVCEPLPAGVTNAAAYDSVSTFDGSAFAY